MKYYLLIFCLALTIPSYSQKFTDSACTRYFEITDRLRAGDSLSRDTWQSFLKDKSIQTYMQDQGVGDAYFESYRRNMQIVYMPQKSELLNARLKDSSTYWLTYMIYQYKKHEAGMRAYLSNIKNNPGAYFNSCYNYAYSALPKSAHKKLPEMVFSIIPIHNDAHAETNLIIYTLLCAYFNDMNRYGALGGHELHHALRPQPDFKMEEKDKAAVTLMYVVLNEGTADMVDKKYMTDTASKLLPYQRYFKEFFDEAKPVLPNLDSLLQITAQTGKAFKIREYLKPTSYTSGHVPGMYMAHYIEKHGKKRKMIQHIADPFYFFILYNQAAKKDADKPYVFSKKTMDYIQRLQKKYQ